MLRSSYSHSANTNELHFEGHRKESILKSEHYTEMGKRIRAIRLSRGLTLEQAAERLEISRTTTQLFEQGKSLNLDNILRICLGYDCTIAQILPNEFLEYTSSSLKLLSCINEKQILPLEDEIRRINPYK